MRQWPLFSSLSAEWAILLSKALLCSLCLALLNCPDQPICMRGWKTCCLCALLFPGWVPHPSLSLPTLPLLWVVILDSFVLMPPFYRPISLIPAFIISLLSQGLLSIQYCIYRTGFLLHPPCPSISVPRSKGRNCFASQKARGVIFMWWIFLFSLALICSEYFCKSAHPRS